MTIGPAAGADVSAVKRLLEAADLPLDDLDAHVATMVVAKTGDGVVGAAAVELYADGALLRSVVVSPSVQGQGLGRRLVEAALQLAKTRGLETAFLLTTTAERYFPRMGFEPITRADVPAFVQGSVEFRSACPASATVMRRRLT